MKRVTFIISIIFILSPIHIFAQQYTAQQTFVATGITDSVNIRGRGLNFFKLQWVTDAPTLPSACSIKLQISSNNSVWTDAITGTCTTDGASAITQVNANYIRLNLASYTAVATGETVVNIIGFNVNPGSGGGGGGDVNLASLGGTTLSGTNIVDVPNSALKINCVTGCGAVASFTDNTAFTAGSTTENNVGGVFNDGLTAVTSGNAAAARITNNRGLHTNLRNASGTEIATSSNPVRTDPTGTTTQPVSGTITANAGTNLNTSALALDATLTGRTQKSQITDGTRDGTVKAASTAAAAGDTSVVVGLSPNSPIPTGSNTIGAISNTGFNATQSGTWTVQPGNTANTTAWKVDGSAVTQPVSGTITANAGTGNFNVIGTKTNNNAAAGATNIGTLGAIANAAAPTYTEGNLIALSTDLNGALRVSGSSGATQYAEDTAATSGEQVIMAGIVQQNSDAALANDGDRTEMQVDATGFLKVNIKAGVAQDAADNATVTTNPVPIGCVYQSSPTALTNGQVGYVNCNTIKELKVSQDAGISTTTTMQNAVAANGNGTVLAVDGQSSAILTVNCASCSGGTTVNFEAQNDGSNFAAVMATMLGTSTLATTTTTAGLTYWQIPVAGFKQLRARVSAYSAGTITVTGTTVPVEFNSRTINSNTFFAGTASSTGNGVTGSASQRVTIASDNSAVTGFGVGATGSAVPANAEYLASQDGSGNLIGDLNCDSNAIFDASTSGSTELVALTSSKVIYVCGFHFFSAGTVNVKLVYGTGTNCATSPSNLTPAYQFIAQTGIAPPWPTHGFMVKTAASNALCINLSAGVAVQAMVFYQKR